jgi:hypothetical protein
MSAPIMRRSTDFNFAAFSIDPNAVATKHGRGVFLNTIYKENGTHQRVKMQTPLLKAPFGLSTWSNEGEADKHTLSLNLAPCDGNDEAVREFYEWLERLDAVIVQHIFEHQGELFPQVKARGQKMSRDTIRQLYSGFVKPPSNADFPATTRIKVQEVFGRMPAIFNQKREKVGLEAIQKGTHVIGIVDLGSIWLSPTQITASLRLVQLQVVSGPVFEEPEEDVFMFDDNGQFSDWAGGY